MKKKETKTDNPKKFEVSKYLYRYPFKCMDDTPGGDNLGKIEWCIEPVYGKKKRGRYFIESLLVWARQTRDKKYSKKLFLIHCFAGAITGDSLNRQDYLNHVWYWGICSEHKRPFMVAYPQKHHSVLEINTGSSISIEIKFI